MEISKQNPLIGAHMSISGGIKNALLAGESINCTAIQLFTANNRQWSFNSIPENSVQEYLDYRKNSSVQGTVSHASYLINLGSPKEEVAEKSKKALAAELERCNQINVPYTVMHPGAYLNSGPEECLERIAKNLSEVLATTPGCMVLLENTAGQGTNLGYRFEQLASIIELVEQKERVGVCFDTCHAFAAGYDFFTPEKYAAMWKEFDSLIGLEKLKVIHLNDSLKPCGSRVDRHEHIGQGCMGLEPFRLIMNDDNFIEIPKILETPKDKDLKEDRENLAILKKLII